MNFADEFKKRAKKINAAALLPIGDLKASEKKEMVVPFGTPLFMIFKRSLPVAVNQAVLMNLLEDDADKAMKRLKATQYKDPDGTSHCIYYEKVSASIKQPDNLYFNPKPAMLSESGMEILHGSDAVNFNYNFID